MQRNSKEPVYKTTICEEGDRFGSTRESANSLELHPPTQVGGSQTSGNGASESHTRKKIAEDEEAQVCATFDDMGLREDQREETRMMRERESDGRIPRRQYKIDILYGRV